MAAKKKTAPSAEDGEVYEVSSGSYDDWTVAELRKRAKELGLSGYSGKKKAALLALLRDY